MYQFLFFLLLLSCAHVKSQPTLYSVANAHSHNDYEQDRPFWKAYEQGFGSIEADIFLRGDALLVAHDSAEVSVDRTLDSLYLRPLAQCVATNKGNVYADSTRNLILLIDIKTEAISTLARLVKAIGKYPVLMQCRSLQFMISGNRPDPALFTGYPSYIWFDGVPGINYSKESLARVGLLSDNMRKYTQWNGSGLIPPADLERLEALVAKAHGLNKRLRLWNAPDNINTWLTLIKLKADLVNTDKIPELAAFLRQLPEKLFTATLAGQ